MVCGRKFMYDCTHTYCISSLAYLLCVSAHVRVTNQGLPCPWQCFPGYDKRLICHGPIKATGWTSLTLSRRWFTACLSTKGERKFKERSRKQKAFISPLILFLLPVNNLVVISPFISHNHRLSFSHTTELSLRNQQAVLYSKLHTFSLSSSFWELSNPTILLMRKREKQFSPVCFLCFFPPTPLVSWFVLPLVTITFFWAPLDYVFLMAISLPFVVSLFLAP